MKTSPMQTISFARLAISFLPALAVIVIHIVWSLKASRAIYAVSRMLAQLLLIGYLLRYIFESDTYWVILMVLTIMMLSSSWIALGTVKQHRLKLYKAALLAIAISGTLILTLVTQAVLCLEPWYRPQYMIPLAGMIFANSMNSVSLAADRYYAEATAGKSYIQARSTAFQASLIPIRNSLFAVGLVSLPGLMTGQILAGVSPFIAARYQIMVMCMLFGAAGMSSAGFLLLAKKYLITNT